MEKEEYEELRRILLSHGILEEDVDGILEFIKSGGDYEFLNKDK